MATSHACERSLEPLSHHPSQGAFTMRGLRSALLTLVIFLALGPACGVDAEPETYQRPTTNEPWVLVDLWHTRIQNPEDYRLTKGNYVYQGVFGYYRLFEHLTDHGYRWASIRTMPLSEERLAGFDVLFINLVHDERPDFTQEEIRAIDRFVYNGGGLFIIADHTNVYRHAERINPILKPMGIEVTYHTAVDYPPDYSVGGLGWLLLHDFVEHPVSAGLDVVSLQTGGVLNSEGGLAFTSQQSFADFWNPEETSGFYGNWTWDGDAEVEPRGPLAGVAAMDYGQGRVVVAGDQNMFGDAWVHFGSNFELALNSFEWLAQRESDVRRLRQTRPRGFNLAVDMHHSHFRGARAVDDGFYNFFVHLNRDTDVTARARPKLEKGHDALMLVQPDVPLDEAALDVVRDYLERGKKVWIGFEPNQIPQATADLLHALDPEFSFVAGNRNMSVDTPEARAALVGLRPPELEGRFALRSSLMDVQGLSLASHKVQRNRETSEAPDSYLYNVRSSWGEPLLQAEHDGRTVDLARRKKIGNGELVVFLQDGFFRNRTLGAKEVVAPDAFNEDAVRLIYRCLDYLKK